MLPLGGGMWEGPAGRAAVMYEGMGKQEKEPWGTAQAQGGALLC